MTVINTLSTLSISAFSKFSRKAIYIGEKGKKPKIDNVLAKLITAPLVDEKQFFGNSPILCMPKRGSGWSAARRGRTQTSNQWRKQNERN